MGKLAKRDVFCNDSRDIKERMRNRQAEETFEIVIPNAILNQPAILPQRAGRATDDIERKGGAKNGYIALREFQIYRCHKYGNQIVYDRFRLILSIIACNVSSRLVFGSQPMVSLIRSVLGIRRIMSSMGLP